MLRSAEPVEELAKRSGERGLVSRETVLRLERKYGMSGNVLMVIIIVTMVFLFLLIIVTPLVSAA